MTSVPKISREIDVHDLPDLDLQALWALDALCTDTADRFSATTIANFLVEQCGVNTYRQAVAYALEKDNTLAHKNKDGYKLMQPGRTALAVLITNRVVFIESGKPFSAKNVLLKDLFARLKGEILICDPFVDIRTLDVLFKNVEKQKPVKVLTRNVSDKPTGTFARHLGEMRSEGFQIAIAQYAASELHDRYIMDDVAFWLSGNSLNHLGNKESFLVSLGDDIRKSMLQLFNSRWSAAAVL